MEQWRYEQLCHYIFMYDTDDEADPIANPLMQSAAAA
jgi:hypothetical protein